MARVMIMITYFCLTPFENNNNKKTTTRVMVLAEFLCLYFLNSSLSIHAYQPRSVLYIYWGASGE